MKAISEDDQRRLDELNDSVKEAIAKRREWLDGKMKEYAEMQVGDYIYDLETGRVAGRVTELYRLWRDNDDGFRDDALAIEYRFEKHPGIFDNTSRQPFRLGSKAESEVMLQLRLDLLRIEVSHD